MSNRWLEIPGHLRDRVHGAPPQAKRQPRTGMVNEASGEMNKSELKYAMDVLERRRMCGEILRWKPKAMKLRLAKRTHITPDFTVWMPDRTVDFHEFKGFVEDDAIAKLKIAAEMYREHRFFLVRRKGNEFLITHIRP